jgi:integrase
MAGVQVLGPHQFRVQIRRNGVNQDKTFETYRQAATWRSVMEGKITGDEFVDQKVARSTTVAKACTWMIDGNHIGKDARNIAAKLRYWQDSEFADWSLVALHDWDLIEWRRKVLDEENAEDGTCGPDPECGAQTAIHRLNALSKVFQTWARAHKVPLDNPVKPGVRPGKPEGRNRRLAEHEERRLLNAARVSSRPWLRPAIAISIETCMRQSELAGLTWDRVKPKGPHPHCDLPKTKNDRARRVPLSRRAVVAFGMPKKNAGRVLPVETSRGIIHAFRDSATEDAFPDLRWHDLRHEGISRLFEFTDLRKNEIMAITGHLTPAMLARYTHLRADRLASRLRGGRLNRRERD